MSGEFIVLWRLTPHSLCYFLNTEPTDFGYAVRIAESKVKRDGGTAQVYEVDPVATIKEKP